MLITRTPFRISFLGGGTDYPAWYLEHGGAVIATSIDKYCYISCRYLPPFFEHRSRIVYSKIECVNSNSEIQHPSVRETLKHMGIREGIEIHHDGDLPARAGLGSSSAFTVGLLHALYSLKREMRSKMQLAMEGIQIERNLLKENVGSQDQVLSAFGGFNRVDFLKNGEINVSPIVLDGERLKQFQNHLMLYFTGFSRVASEIAKQQIENIRSKRCDLNDLYQMVDGGLEILMGKENLSRFGALLDEAWKVKRGLTQKISTPAIDEIYQAAKDAGAIGGKLLGAGGGGFMVIFADPSKHQKINEKLKKLLLVPFQFDNTGSHIVFYQPDDQSTEIDWFRVQREREKLERERLASN